LYLEVLDDRPTATKTNATSESTVPKEKKNVVVKRDIMRKEEPLYIVFCGHVDAEKSIIGRQLM
jgi:hypothetical protein